MHGTFINNEILITVINYLVLSGRLKNISLGTMGVYSLFLYPRPYYYIDSLDGNMNNAGSGFLSRTMLNVDNLLETNKFYPFSIT